MPRNCSTGHHFWLEEKFRQVIQIFALIQKCTRAENDLAIGKKMSYTWLHIMEFPEKEMMSAKHPETFLERLSWCYKWGLKSASIFDLNYRGQN